MADVQTLAVANAGVNARKSIDRALAHQYHLTPISGPAAKAELDSVDLIIYDLRSGRDSRDLISDVEALRRSKPDLPVLVLAPEKPAEHLVLKVLDLGAIDFVRKPLNEDELNLRVFRCLRLSRISAEWQKHDAGQRRAPLAVPLQGLHGSSGRLDASRIAKYMNIPLAALVEALGTGYTSLHKTPDSASVQQHLSKIKRVLVILSEMLGKREVVLAWLNNEHPDLGGRTPLAVSLEGHADVVLTMLENALEGIPS